MATGLTAIASTMPVRNKLIADQQKAARSLQLQQAIAGMPAGAPPVTKQQVGQMAGQMAQAAGQQQVAQAGQMIEQASQLGKAGLAEEALAGQKRLLGMQEAARAEGLDQLSRLAQVDANAKKSLFDDQLQFRKDRNNATMFTERQLLDYASQAANKDEAYKNWAQKTKQYSDRTLKMIDIMDQKLKQALETGYLTNKQKLDQQSAQEIAQIRKELADKKARAEAKAANISNMTNALGTLMTTAGTAAMFVPGGQAVGAGLMVGGTAVTAAGQAEAQKQAREELR